MEGKIKYIVVRVPEAHHTKFKKWCTGKGTIQEIIYKLTKEAMKK